MRWTLWLKAVFTAAAVALLVKMLLVTSCIIPSSGMENSLYQGEGILVNKWSYGLRVPFPSLWGYHRLGKNSVEKGDIFLFNNPDPRRESEWMERRELFISRCTGVAGDTLMLNRELTEIGGEVLSPDSKELYAYPSAAEDLVWEALQSIGIAEENKLVSYLSDGSYIRSFSHYEYYLMVQKLGGKVVLTPLTSKQPQEVYPFVVPRKGMPVKVYPWNVALLCNTIRAHEHRQAEVCRDTLWVEGVPVSEYAFTKDYYWVSSNDPVNLCDSRLFGFVPEDYIIGKACLIWFTSRKGRFLQRVQ
ncbi:MAG: S26 family signal peptidase [Bacteroides sp.]|nr:S26 family signal peptidase [Bacteroides sp.]